jgi:hypothetical protein
MKTRARSMLAACLLLATGCRGHEATRPAAAGGLASGPAPASARDAARPGARARHDIGLTLDPRIAKGATRAVVEACPLKHPDDKPDGVAPAHLAIRFGADAGAPQPCSVPGLEHAGLYVFPAAEYGRALASAAASLRALEKLLAAREMPAGDSLPFVPFVDASFALSERAIFIDFQGGTGVLVLVEVVVEPDTVGDELLFVFQGLSRDGARYLLGIFPVTRAPAPKPFPVDPHAPFEEQTRAFEPYRREVARALAAARDEEFAPRPSWLSAMLGTLRL